VIKRVKTRVGRLGARAYAGRHILNVSFDTCLWGLAIRVGMPQRTADAGLSKTFRMADKNVLFPIPARSTAPMSS
jgi:hypothetical protein